MRAVIADAFPRKPAPHRPVPEPGEIEAAMATYALHIPSLVTRACLGCGEQWPCPDRRESEGTLDRAGLIDVNGDPRA